MEHNLETLRTRVTQVADLRDAQGIREDHRAILARLNEVEECATVHTLREFMSKIRRLEAMLTGCGYGCDSNRSTSGIVIEGLDHAIGIPWMISTLESAHRNGIMISLTKKVVRKRKINLILRTDHPGRRRLRGHAPTAQTNEAMDENHAKATTRISIRCFTNTGHRQVPNNAFRHDATSNATVVYGLQPMCQ